MEYQKIKQKTKLNLTQFLCLPDEILNLIKTYISIKKFHVSSRWAFGSYYEYIWLLGINKKLSNLIPYPIIIFDEESIKYFFGSSYFKNNFFKKKKFHLLKIPYSFNISQFSDINICTLRSAFNMCNCIEKEFKSDKITCKKCKKYRGLYLCNLLKKKKIKFPKMFKLTGNYYSNKFNCSDQPLFINLKSNFNITISSFEFFLLDSVYDDSFYDYGIKILDCKNTIIDECNFSYTHYDTYYCILNQKKKEYIIFKKNFYQNVQIKNCNFIFDIYFEKTNLDNKINSENEFTKLINSIKNIILKRHFNFGKSFNYINSYITINFVYSTSKNSYIKNTSIKFKINNKY